MRFMAVFVGVGFVMFGGAAGCKSEPSGGASLGTGAAAGAALPAAARAPSASHDFVALLVAQHGPALVGPFAALELAPELTIGDARRRAPALFDPANVMKALDWFEYKGSDYPGVSLRTERFGQIDSDPDTWLVGRLRAVIGDSALEGKLTQAWGAPRKAGTRSLWFAPAAHLRCSLELADGRDAPTDAMVLDCDRYLPLAELIGTDKVLFGFEGKVPVLGAQPGELARRFGRRMFDEGARIMLPPTELALRSTDVQIGDMEAPERVTFMIIKIDDPPAAAALLQAKFGAPREDANLGRVYRARPRVVLDSFGLTVGIPPGE